MTLLVTLTNGGGGLVGPPLELDDAVAGDDDGTDLWKLFYSVHSRTRANRAVLKGIV